MPTIQHPFNSSKRISLKEAREIHAELVEEAQDIINNAGEGDLSPKNQARWDQLMDEEAGEIKVAEATLKKVEVMESRMKDLALSRLQGQSPNPYDTDFDNAMGAAAGGKKSAATPVFRCTHTGNLIKAVAHDMPVAKAPGPETLGLGDGGARIGAVLASILTGRNDFATGSQIQAAITGNDSGGGYLINPELSSQVVDLARSASVAMRAGALTVPMESTELNIARLTGDPTGHWRAEGSEVKTSDVTFDRVTLRPKMLAAIVPISIELLEDAANAATIIEQAIMAALGLQLDKAILLGAGSENTPRGIANFDEVNKTSAVGTPANYSKVSSAIGDIHRANFDGEASSMAWIMHPRDAETFDGLTDTTGQPLNPTPWADDLQRLTTTSLPTDEGGGSNESISMLGDFSQCVVGMRTTGVNIRILDSGEATDADGDVHNAVTQFKKFIVAHLRADVALLRPQWFSLLEGITAA